MKFIQVLFLFVFLCSVKSSLANEGNLLKKLGEYNSFFADAVLKDLSKNDLILAKEYYESNKKNISNIAKYNLATNLAINEELHSALNIYQDILDNNNSSTNEEVLVRTTKNYTLISLFLEKNPGFIDIENPNTSSSNENKSKSKQKNIELKQKKEYKEPFLPTNSFDFFVKTIQ